MNWIKKIGRIRFQNWEHVILCAVFLLFLFLRNSPNTIRAGLAARNDPSPIGPWRFWTTVFLALPLSVIGFTLLPLALYNFMHSPDFRQRPKLHWVSIVALVLAVPALWLMLQRSEAAQGYSLVMYLLFAFFLPFLNVNRKAV
jgi:hypothetical protein